MSNLPLVFISISDIFVEIDDNLSFSVEGVYFYYRFWKLFTGPWEQMLGDLRIEKIAFSGHINKIDDYIEQLRFEYLDPSTSTQISTPTNDNKKIEFHIQNMDMSVSVKQLEFVLRAMTEFRYSFFINNTKMNLKNNALDFGARMNMKSIWSNCVFLASSTFDTKASFSDVTNLVGDIYLNFLDLNLAGLPVIDKLVTLKLSMQSNQITPTFINQTKQNISFDTSNNDFQFGLDKSFVIAYDEFEEYELLDYAFAPGDWDFKFNLKQSDSWFVNSSLKSKEHPNYGLDLLFEHFTDNIYKLKLDLKTHYFGSIDANLLVYFEKGFYPLASGTLTLEDVRFILAGLVFSGDVVVDRIPNKNAMYLTAFNVEMNNGYIGHTATIFEFPPGQFIIKPVPIPNMAIEVNADIGKRVWVYIKALDVDGDFVYENIKLPFFGIPDARYRGDIYITKSVPGQPVFIGSQVKGYLDDEEQIVAEFKGKDNLLEISKFYFVNQDLLFKGTVDIKSFRSNTIVDINALGQLNTNAQIPIDVNVFVQKTNSLVTGMIDDQILFKTESDTINTAFNISFNNYLLDKIGLPGDLAGDLRIDFDTVGWKNFYIHHAGWTINDQTFHLSFDSSRVSNVLDVANLKIGLNTETLNGSGYFSISDNTGFAGAFNFQRGGSLSFATSVYTWKLNTDIYNFYISDLGKLPMLNKLNIPEQFISSVIMDLNFGLNGLFGNPDINAKIALNSAGNTPYFKLVIPVIEKTTNTLMLTNIRVRSDLINLDTDLFLENDTNYLSARLSGAFAFQDLAKTKYSLDFFSSNNLQLLKYQLSNLYFLSKRPMTLSGSVFASPEKYFWVSDHPRYGIAGSYLTKNKSWDFNFKSDSVQIHTTGCLTNENNIVAALTSELMLDKMLFSGDIHKMNGVLSLDTTINGNIDNPTVNGQLSLNNIQTKIGSLKNKIRIPGVVAIPISNNTIIFPDININAGRDNNFGLKGNLEFRDRGISEANILFYSKNEEFTNKISSLNWDARFPYLSFRGKTLIDQFSLSGNGGLLTLAADITTENMTIGLELGDSFSTIGRSEDTDIKPVVALMSLLEFDVNINLQQGFRFANQLFDLTFEKNAGVVAIQGNISDNTILITGDMDITKGRINYLNTDLKVESGTLQFPIEYGDPLPLLNLQTITTKFSTQNEQVDIYVNFQGKLPNVELASISSTPTLQPSELLNILSGGTTDRVSSRDNNNQSSEEFLANGVEVAENLLFTSPLSQRIQRLLPFIDMIEIKTDFLGNITRVLSDGGIVTGVSILHGSELSIGQFIPNLPNFQVRYDLRLESPYNSSVNTSDDLVQIHKAGLEWSYPINRWRLAIRPSILGKIGDPQNEAPEFLIESSARFKW
ncbi:MAG: translocation/assembly module TamB domain-containing protein [Brevinema sp.]